MGKQLLHNDAERQEALVRIIHRLQDGESVEDVQAEFARHFDGVEAIEIAHAEAALIASGAAEVADIQRLCNVHATLFEGDVTAGDMHASTIALQTPGHPAFVFYQESVGLQAEMEKELKPAFEDYASLTPEDGEEAVTRAEQRLTRVANSIYRGVDRHYKRKEILLFPYLERSDITAPPKVMWGKDDEIRAIFKSVLAIFEEGSQQDTLSEQLDLRQELLERQGELLIEELDSMIMKEHEILLPMLLDVMTVSDWIEVGFDSDEIGYSFTGGIEGASPSDAKEWLNRQQNLGSSDAGAASAVNAQEELKKAASEGEIVLGSGRLTLTELESLLNTLPIDITYVGADDTVHYFSENPGRVFPRTRSIVGRDVSNCHPPKSLHVVEQLVEDLRSGRKDKEYFWINKGDVFIMIRYYAVRDTEGTYLGVLEVTEEISELRSLTGSKTLLAD